jgi:hypothetical protein
MGEDLAALHTSEEYHWEWLAVEKKKDEIPLLWRGETLLLSLNLFGSVCNITYRKNMCALTKISV